MGGRPGAISLAAVLSAVLSVPCLAQTDRPAVRPSDRPTIDTIIIVNGNVFDHEDAAPDWVAQLANRLHVKTRPWVIRRRLLLSRGDPFDRARMEESERALRTLGVFRSVRVDTVRFEPDGKLAVRAVTSDGWSTQPQASFTSAGGDKTWDIGLVERNFLGTATEVALIYGRNPDRSHLDFDFINPLFFGRRTLLTLRYRDLSDGRRGEWHFGLPFHETSAPYSLETYGEAAQERVLRFRDDVLVDSMRHHLFRVGLIGGIAASANSHRYTRLWGGWEWRREDFGATDTSRVPYSVFATLRAGIDVGSVRFRVLEHFNSFARREDVDLSPMFRAGVVLQSGVGYEVSAQTSAVWKRGFAVLRVAANGLDSTRTQAQVTVVSQDIPRHTLIAHAEAGVLTHPKPGAEFDPWMVQRGPRLFGVHDFTGTRTTWFVLEDRILVADDILGLMAMGLAPFLDYGGAWYGDEPVRQGGDVGMSLRFGPTRAVRGEAAEMAFGYRFGVGVKGKRWAFTLRKGFSF
jgi:surface antigen-like variable number repeat protein